MALIRTLYIQNKNYQASKSRDRLRNNAPITGLSRRTKILVIFGFGLGLTKTNGVDE